MPYNSKEKQKDWETKNIIRRRQQKNNWAERNHVHLQKYHEKYYEENRQQILKSAGENAKKRNLKRKKLIIHHYSKGKNICYCCGESIFEFLTIDHKNNDGYKQRKEIGQSMQIYKWIIDNNYPDGIQIACHNCNWGRSRFKICPHKKLKIENLTKSEIATPIFYS